MDYAHSAGDRHSLAALLYAVRGAPASLTEDGLTQKAHPGPLFIVSLQRSSRGQLTTPRQ